MSKKALRKNTYREIRQSFGRFLAILAIVALGVGLFSGLKITKDTMLTTGDEYFREKHLYDFRLVSTLGIYDEDIEAVKNQPFVTLCEGAYGFDALVDKDDNTSTVAKLHSISENVNEITVIEGRLPEKPSECVIDSKWFAESMIGRKLIISKENSDNVLDSVTERELTVVGICKAVMYVNFERGNTTLGSGKIGGYIYVLPSLFDTEYYTDMYVCTDMSREKIYTDAYKDGIERESDILKPLLSARALDKYKEIKNDANKEIDEAKEKLSDAKKEISDNEAKIADGEKDIADGEKKIADSEKEIADGEKELSDAEKEIAKAEKELKDKLSELEAAEAELDANSMFFPANVYMQKKAEIAYGKAAIEEGKKEISKNRKELEKGREKLSDAKLEIEKALEDIEKGKKDIAEAKEKIADAKAEIGTHETELADAEEKINSLEEPDTYVLTRTTNIGYASFENDSKIVEGVGNVFPVFFFLVAALVCMTTMNRMVEEKRTEIGTMKALGYSEAAIMAKYLFYSGSAALIGCTVGYMVGIKVFPYVIWETYKIMYTISDIRYINDGLLLAISIIVSVICSMGATYFTLKGELRSNASDLIRPKAPANGKRVFLERIGFIWKRLKFTTKVSVRNVFRYKKRFFMMILGVGGCYGLLITGFGIKDSIADVCDCQFNNIQKYGITASIKDNTALSDRGAFDEALKGKGEYTYVSTKSVDVETFDRMKSATLVVYSEGDFEGRIDNFVNFVDDRDRPLSLPEKGGAIVSSKMAKMLGVKVGDSVVCRDPDLNEITVKITGIMKNYVYNWVYISEETFTDQRKESPDYNTAFVRSEEDHYALGAALGDIDFVSAVSVADEMSVRINNMMQSLNQIVFVVTLCAAMLAFIVMYNLTNINITERLREIATLKVLGFYPMESALYVFRENMFLTVLGMFVGVFLGNALHRFVMANINVEVVSFDIKILPVSYLYAVIFTFMFALIVDFVLFFKLERIKMAESLKSVE